MFGNSNLESDLKVQKIGEEPGESEEREPFSVMTFHMAEVFYIDRQIFLACIGTQEVLD